MSEVAVIAHRGASGSHPENTAAAFGEALRLGVEAIELDVTLSADRELIVIHDQTVDRTSDGSGQVRRMKLDQIKALDAGGWFGAEFVGERFLTLGEALDLLEGEQRLNVHAKADDHNRDDLAPMVARELVRRELFDRAFIASDQLSLALVRRVDARLGICNLSTQPYENYILRSRAIECRILQPGNAATTAELVAEAHSHGMEVNPFFADDEKEMQRLVDCGVDGILTNEPAKLQALLGRPAGA
jgi:glycerophosphoryl diester phosphodiesterase